MSGWTVFRLAATVIGSRRHCLYLYSDKQYFSISTPSNDYRAEFLVSYSKVEIGILSRQSKPNRRHQDPRTFLHYPLFLLGADAVVIIGAWLAVFYFRVVLNTAIVSPIKPWQSILIVAATVPLWLISFAVMGLYRAAIYENRVRQTGRLLLGSIIGGLILIGVDFFLNQALLPGRLVVVYGLVGIFIALLLGRDLVRFGRRRLFRAGYGVRNVAIIGASPVAISLIESLLEEPNQGSSLVAVASRTNDLSERLRPGVRFYQDPLKIPYRRLGVSLLIVADAATEPGVNRQIIETALKNYVQVKVVPTDSDLLQASVELDIFWGQPMLTIRPTTLGGFGLISKRLFDIVGATVGLLFLSPFLLILMGLIKISSPSDPVIFRHQRLTRQERNIYVYKLRTMYQRYSSQNPRSGLRAAGRPDLARSDDPQPVADPRVTRLGAWLRRYSIDELPQLINVLKGDISLVGPRALPRRELVGFERYIPTLMSVKTGMTGLAQVNGRANLTMHQKVQLNIYYIQNWSVWLDGAIIIKTVGRVIRQKDINV